MFNFLGLAFVIILLHSTTFSPGTAVGEDLTLSDSGYERRGYMKVVALIKVCPPKFAGPQGRRGWRETHNDHLFDAFQCVNQGRQRAPLLHDVFLPISFIQSKGEGSEFRRIIGIMTV